MTKSSGNGHGQNAEARVRRDIMMVCVRNFTATYDGKVVELRADLDRVGGDHERMSVSRRTSSQ
jgi:hypothetical protein